jgi:hypothetical protein
MTDLGTYHNDIKSLNKLSKERYENIFKVYTTSNDNGDTYLYYNILNKVKLPRNIDSEYLEDYQLISKLPWTSISYDIYGTQHLWWLIYIINNFTSPFILPEAGSIITVIKKDHLNSVISQINIK